MATLSALKFNTVDGAKNALGTVQSLEKQQLIIISTNLSKEEEDRLRAAFAEDE